VLCFTVYAGTYTHDFLGAGKTETTKLCLSFLSEIAASDIDGSQGMEQKILASNPILESFGNAKTLRNNNSSRYGKFINLIFNDNGILQGCETKNFLLEKSRVHMQAFGERSYHIFYQLCRASIEEADCFSMGDFGNIMKKQDERHRNSASSLGSTTMRANLSALGLKHPDEFNYLNQSGCTDIYLVSDQESFHEMEFAATKLGFSKQQLNIAFSACACVLHLGNLSFVNNESAGGCNLVSSQLCEVSLAHVATLLEVSESTVVDALTKRELKARGEVTLVLLNAAQANETRDALAKAIYMQCFDFLINVINVELSVEAFQGRRDLKFTPPTTIGVLDIYGFEVFDMNGFEQLFINYANEKLQQHFNHHTFEEEIKACERENINCEDFTYLDNQDTLDLIESKNSGKNGGILKILDDECKFPRGTDEAFLNKLKISQKDNPLISFSRKFTDLGFDIFHYAGSVNYTVKDFLEKNKDKLSDDLQVLLRNSSVRRMSTEFDFAESEKDLVGRAKAKQLTVAGKFQKDLNNLLVQLNNSEPHFIRCIKPNEEKEPNIFNHALVHRQLKQSGAFDALSIRKRGYQFQFPHAVFMQRYRPLVVKYKSLDSKKPMRNRCMDLITTLSLKIPGMKSLSKNMQVGDTMVFWKSAEDVMLSELRKEIVRSAVLCLQRFIRGGVLRCRIIKIQNVIRSARKLIKKHKDIKDAGVLVTFESECEFFQELTIYKDFFEESNIKPYFEKVLAENLSDLEERIDCINQLQLHCHKTFNDIDEGWLAATEKAMELNLLSVESEKMIAMYKKEVKSHGKLLVEVLKKLRSPDLDVDDIQESIDSIDRIRERDPQFAVDLSATLKKNVAKLESENKLVYDLLKVRASEVSAPSAVDRFLPFQQHMNETSLSKNFTDVLKVVDYVVEMRDIVLTTLINATGEDPSVVPFFPPPPAPRGRNVPVRSSDANKEVDFEDDEFEKSSIVKMSGHVSMKAIESELWSASKKHFHLFEEVKADLADRALFAVVIDLAAKEVNMYKEAIGMCHSVVMEAGSVLSSRNSDLAAGALKSIENFNQFIVDNCKLLTTASGECEEDADNISHPYFSKRLDLANKKLMRVQYNLLLELEGMSLHEREARQKLATAAAQCISTFTGKDYVANKQAIDAVKEAIYGLKERRSDVDGFVYADCEDMCNAADYSVEIRELVNEIFMNPNYRQDEDSLSRLEQLLMSSNAYEDLDSFISQSEMDSFRENVFNLKVKNSKLMDGKKQFIKDLQEAVANEDEGLLTFLLGKVSSQDFEFDTTINDLVEKGHDICRKYQQLKSIAQALSLSDATAAEIQKAMHDIEALSLKGSGPQLLSMQTRLDILLRCSQRIHSAWYDSPNSVENMVGALQECTQHNYPSCNDVKFVTHLVELWREDYGLYLKALIDLRTFLEDTEAVDELNDELNKLYNKGKHEGDTLEEDEDDELDDGHVDDDFGDRITEDLHVDDDVIVGSMNVGNMNGGNVKGNMSVGNMNVSSVIDGNMDAGNVNVGSVKVGNVNVGNANGGNANVDVRHDINDMNKNMKHMTLAQSQQQSAVSSGSNSGDDNDYIAGGEVKKKKKVFRRVVRSRPSGRQRSNSDVYVERNQDNYKWYKYPKLRTFTDPERERQRKVYTTKNIPTSVTRLDNIIHIQLATAAFKCLLGIMGDKVGTYPDMLKKEFLRIATYHVTLTDELYCQVMKQLTKNPGRVSKAKGVELLQLLVSTVLPTSPLQPYLENFLRSHGALEFVNLLRVLAMKNSAKADKAAEHNSEGWLFNTVGRIMKSYRKRWCVLQGDTFSIFMTKDHSSKIESIPVSQIKSLHYLKKKDENVKAMYAFEILMKNDKSHVFYTT
jgi:myosin heavy subunit